MARHTFPSAAAPIKVIVTFQGTESEQESTGGSGDPMHSFVSHYENVGSTFRQQSWKKQKQKAIAVPTPRAGGPRPASNSNTLGRGAGGAGGAGAAGGGGQHQHHQQQQRQQQQHSHHSNTLGATSLRHQQVRSFVRRHVKSHHRFPSS